MSVWENLRCAVLWTDGHHYSFWKNIDNLKEVRYERQVLSDSVSRHARPYRPGYYLAEQRQ